MVNIVRHGDLLLSDLRKKGCFRGPISFCLTLLAILLLLFGQVWIIVKLNLGYGDSAFCGDVIQRIDLQPDSSLVLFKNETSSRYAQNL